MNVLIIHDIENDSIRTLHYNKISIVKSNIDQSLGPCQYANLYLDDANIYIKISGITLLSGYYYIPPSWKRVSWLIQLLELGRIKLVEIYGNIYNVYDGNNNQKQVIDSVKCIVKDNIE